MQINSYKHNLFSSHASNISDNRQLRNAATQANSAMPNNTTSAALNSENKPAAVISLSNQSNGSDVPARGPLVIKYDETGELQQRISAGLAQINSELSHASNDTGKVLSLEDLAEKFGVSTEEMLARLDESMANFKQEQIENQTDRWIEITPFTPLSRIVYESQNDIFNTLLKSVSDPRDVDIVDQLQSISTLLANGIFTTNSMPNSTREERAMQREAASRMAAEIADKYLNKETATGFMKEIERLLGMDFAIDNGLVKSDFLHIPTMSIPEVPDYNSTLFLRDVMNDDDRRQYNAGLGKPLTNVEELLSRFRLVSSLRDKYTSDGSMYNWVYQKSQQIDSLSQKTKRNYDSMLANQTFSSVNQWNDTMKNMLEKTF